MGVPLIPSHIIQEGNSGYPLNLSYIIWERNSGYSTLFLLYYMGEKEWEHFLDCCPCDIIIPRTTILSQKEHTMSFINRVRCM